MEAGRLGSNHRLEGFFPDYSSSSIIADVIICENMFRVLTSSSSSAGAPLRFFVYDKYLKGLKRNSRVVTTLQKYFQSIWTIGIITLHSRAQVRTLLQTMMLGLFVSLTQRQRRQPISGNQ